LTGEPKHAQLIRVWMLSFRCRSVLAAAGQASHGRDTLLNDAEADARWLERTGMGSPSPSRRSPGPASR
jgi:hypothetical protein